MAVLIGVKCTFIPGPLLWITCLLGAMLAGAVWGFVPGFLKAVCNVNEVIACIMMNYIGMYGVNFLMLADHFRFPEEPIAAGGGQRQRAQAWYGPDFPQRSLGVQRELRAFLLLSSRASLSITLLKKQSSATS
ncbi:MAG: hypothetical protein V8T36_10855 [Ruthenibacterium lactatiformans]